MLSAIDFSAAAILAEVPYLSELQREFYRVYLEARRVALLSEPDFSERK